MNGISCIADPTAGGMGDHFANPGLLFDHGAIDETTPEALVYESRNNGSFKLVALEYIVTIADWEAAHGVRRPEAEAVRPGVRLHPEPEPLRPPGVRLAPRLDLEGQPEPGC